MPQLSTSTDEARSSHCSRTVSEGEASGVPWVQLGIESYEKVAVLIHGLDLFALSRRLNFEVDFRRLRGLFIERCHLVRLTFYAQVDIDGETSAIRPLLDWLDYNGYEVKRTYRSLLRANSVTNQLDSSLEIEMIVGAFLLAPHIDHLVMVGRGSHIKTAVAALQSRGIRVTLISSLKAEDCNASDAARRQVDNFVEVDALKSLIGRAPLEHASSKAT